MVLASKLAIPPTTKGKIQLMAGCHLDQDFTPARCGYRIALLAICRMSSSALPSPFMSSIEASPDPAEP
jgi:hypothetical protein